MGGKGAVPGPGWESRGAALWRFADGAAAACPLRSPSCCAQLLLPPAQLALCSLSRFPLPPSLPPGKLSKGGEPDLNTAARMVLYDWQRGKIPFFTLPPGHTEEKPPVGEAPAAGKAAAGERAVEGRRLAGWLAHLCAVLPRTRLLLLLPFFAMIRSFAHPSGRSPPPIPTEAPLAAEAVTEEDAKGAVDGDPEKAAAAARAMAEEAAAATAKQRRSAIPVQQGFFTPADEGAAEEEEEGSEDIITSGSDDEEGEEGEEAESGEDGGSGSGSGEDDDDDEEVSACLGGEPLCEGCLPACLHASLLRCVLPRPCHATSPALACPSTPFSSFHLRLPAGRRPLWQRQRQRQRERGGRRCRWAGSPRDPEPMGQPWCLVCARDESATTTSAVSVAGLES